MTGSRNIGQLFLALGGNIRLTGCRLLRFRPFGNGVFLNVVVGNDVLVVAGASYARRRLLAGRRALSARPPPSHLLTPRPFLPVQGTAC